MAFVPSPGLADPFSALSHLGGAVAVLALAPGLLRRAGGHPGRLAALGVFALAALLLLSLSGVYHLLAPGSAGRDVMRVLDHAAIFTLIAATFTPVHAIVFRGLWRWGMLGLVWALAVAAIVLKSVFFGAIPEWLGLALYLALGWIGLVSGVALGCRFGLRFIVPLVVGAAAYTAGAAVDFARVPAPMPGVVGAHGLFHLAVLAGLAAHWRFIAGIAGGERVYARAAPATAAPARGYNDAPGPGSSAA